MNGVVKAMAKNKLTTWFVIALTATLVVTGGMFAYAYTTTQTTITAGSGGNDYADVTASAGFPGYTIFGSYRGALPSGYLFDIDPAAGYPGDLAVNVYLDNIDELGKNYMLWAMRIELVNSSNVSVEVEGITKILSLNNGVVSFTSANMTPGSTYYVRSDGGVYKAHPWAYVTGYGTIDPSLTCEVLQAK